MRDSAPNNSIFSRLLNKVFILLNIINRKPQELQNSGGEDGSNMLSLPNKHHITHNYPTLPPHLPIPPFSIFVGHWRSSGCLLSPIHHLLSNYLSVFLFFVFLSQYQCYI